MKNEVPKRITPRECGGGQSTLVVECQECRHSRAGGAFNSAASDPPGRSGI